MKTNRIALAVAALLVVTAATAHAGTVASAAKKGIPVGYASIDEVAGAVLAYGGKGTTGVTVLSHSTGQVSLKFTGKYPDDVSADKVIVQTTAESLSYGVTNTMVLSASPTEIVVAVYHFVSYQLGGDMSGKSFVTLMIGA